MTNRKNNLINLVGGTDVYNVATDFTNFPGGRLDSSGPYSGEKFRKEVLIPICKGNKKVTINLDGVRGYATSWIDEAFGGLVKEGYITEYNTDVNFKLESKDKDLLLTIINRVMVALDELKKELPCYILEEPDLTEEDTTALNRKEIFIDTDTFNKVEGIVYKKLGVSLQTYLDIVLYRIETTGHVFNPFPDILK